MTNEASSRELTRDEFMSGFFSALAVLGITQLVSSPSRRSQALCAALKETAVPQFRELAKKEDIDIHPDYGLSDWVAHGLSWARRNMLLEPAGPLILKIKIGGREGEGWLTATGMKEEFISFASMFLARLEEVKRNAGPVL